MVLRNGFSKVMIFVVIFFIVITVLVHYKLDYIHAYILDKKNENIYSNIITVTSITMAFSIIALDRLVLNFNRITNITRLRIYVNKTLKPNLAKLTMYTFINFLSLIFVIFKVDNFICISMVLTSLFLNIFIPFVIYGIIIQNIREYMNLLDQDNNDRK